MDHLFTPWPASPRSGGLTSKPRLLSNHFFGDVTYDKADGLNTDLHTFNATWELHRADADVLLYFLRTHAGKAFLWAMPRASHDRIWEATDWTRSSDEGDRDIVTVTFEERTMATTLQLALPPPVQLVFRLSSSGLGGPLHLA